MNNAIDLGYLTAEEFVERKSITLRNNPKAILKEKFEVDNYIEGLDKKYLTEINSLAKLDEKPLGKSVRVIVTIVAYNEGAKIRSTLEKYVNQDIDHSQFEIVLLDNHPHDKTKDNTQTEVQKFQNDYPDISVIYAYKVWGKSDIATVGNARKYCFDIALARLHNRGGSKQDTILVSNDADTVDLDSNYFSAIMHEFDANKSVEALVTLTVVPFSAIVKPNIYGALSLWDALDDAVAEGEPRNLIGRSSAYRASIYSAVGGYNPKGKLAGDLETGFLVADAREWDPESVIQLKTTKHVTDPRRDLESIASRIPINEMYYKFVSDPGVRNADNDELLKLIPDELDWELLEEDLDSFWGSGTTGMYKWRGSRFSSDFKKAMKKIGVEYKIVDNRLQLINIDQLLINYEDDFGTLPKVIHSKKREWDPERRKEIQQFFFTVSDSAIACRERMANKIAGQIKVALSANNTSGINPLLRQYKRFAGHDYKLKTND